MILIIVIIVTVIYSTSSKAKTLKCSASLPLIQHTPKESWCRDPDIWTNLGFLAVGVVSVYKGTKTKTKTSKCHSKPLLAMGVALIVLFMGSTWFHVESSRSHRPTTSRRVELGLVADRLGMAASFAMAFGMVVHMVLLKKKKKTNRSSPDDVDFPWELTIIAWVVLSLSVFRCNSPLGSQAWPALRISFILCILIWWCTTLEFDPWIGSVVGCSVLADSISHIFPTLDRAIFNKSGMTGHSWKHLLYAISILLLVIRYSAVIQKKKKKEEIRKKT